VNEVNEVPVTLTAFGATPRDATATIVIQAPGRRLARALTALGTLWGLALVGLFIPVAHFILVPTFVTAGIVMAVLRAREDRRLLLVRGRCPRCGIEQEFAAGGRLTSEAHLDCPHCHNSVGCTLKHP
jgi:hypothetical protein